MRDIIFRGKREDNGEWVEGYYARICETSVISTGKLDLTEWNNIKAKMFVIIPETVGQYTGLTDKNGVKIFEGDILGGYLDDNYPENQTVMEVVWCNCWWGTKEIGCDPDPLEWEDGEILEIVGNVFDNPEMMEGEMK